MNRRNLIRTAMGLPLLASGLSHGLAFAEAKASNARSRRSRVRPSDPAWPGAASWAKLKETVGGNLIEVHSLFGSCATDSNGPACLDTLKNIKNPYWIGDQPAGTQVSGWLDAWTPAASMYAIKARNAADVAAGISFARENNLRLVVKGGGHSYLGTSNAPDSLLIWTHAMNEVTLHDEFVSKGCEGRVAPMPAVSSGAGAVWMDLYHAVTTEAGRYVQGGGCTTVGVAGLVQGGGFGSFSKAFGTSAASLLEAEIITADGQVRMVNACSDPDLFWAIKGGGGGTFGVITRVTLRTHELPKHFGEAGGKIKAQSDAAFKKLIAYFIGFYHEKLFNAHWGEAVHIWPDNSLEISMSSQGLNGAQIADTWRAFVEWVNAQPKDFAVVSPFYSNVMESRRFWDVSAHPWLVRDAREGAPQYHAWNKGNEGECGAFLNGYDSLWLPASLLQDERRRLLVEALFAASRHKLVRLHVNKGLAGGSPEALATSLATSMNPAVLDAFTLVIIADGDEKPAYPGMPRPAIDLAAAHKDAHEIDLAAAELRKIAPGAGSYVAESNYFNTSWRNAYWGENYARLRAIKAKYDPDGLFLVHHGVGSEDWSADGFIRRV